MATTSRSMSPTPGQAVPVERMPGHWVLAGLGKRVLRPGGRQLTRRLIDAVAIGSDDDVVELAPGLGATTALLLERDPRSYVGVDRDPTAVVRAGEAVRGPNRRVVEGSASETGLDDRCVDVAFGEAYLTMQTSSLKQRILAELARIVRPGGRLALHEIAFSPEDIDADTVDRIRSEMSGSIKVHVAPLTIDGWVRLVEGAGFEVEERLQAPLHLLEPRRLLADEGLAGTARFLTNVARRSDARARVVEMRSVMRCNAQHLGAIGLVARRRER